MATSSETCAFTPRKYFAEVGKNVRKRFDLAYRILASEIIIF